jgi:diguanylate cyclase (GGDEF)-like protein
VNAVNKRKRSKEEIILLMLCALSIPSILPFGIYRLIQHTWLSATIDLVIVGGVSCVMAYVWFTGRVKAASLLVTIFYSFGMVAAIYVKGVNLIYWTYPTMISAFFMLRPNIALAINTVSLSALVAILISQVPLLNLFTIAVTFILINLFSYIFSHRTAIQHNELYREAERDFLTGVDNRRALERHLAKYGDDASERVESSVLLLDIDHFKRINDQFGHAVGDAVLVSLCELIRSRTRTSDKIFRYGGEEFIIIAHAADLRSARGLADDLRSLVAGAAIIENYPITISIGVACMEEDQAPSEWLARADQMLYLAKQSGRNTVMVAE